MPDANTLEVLVKLASLGTSGICILIVFWIGWILLRRSTADQDKEQHRDMRCYMFACILIAIISAVAGIWEGSGDKKELTNLREWKKGFDEMNVSYTIKGIVEKDDGQDPGDATILKYPRARINSNSEIVNLRVCKDKEGILPDLGIICDGYQEEGIVLNGKDIKNRVIDIKTITLKRLP